MHYITHTHTRSGGEIRTMHAECTQVPSRTQTRSSNRSPSFECMQEEMSQDKFRVKSFRKYCRQFVCVYIYIFDRCHFVLYLRDRGTQTNIWKEYKNEKLHFIHLKKYRKNTLYISVWRLVRILSKITCTAFRCIR